MEPRIKVDLETRLQSGEPVIVELQVPITVFICTAWLDDDSPMAFDAWGQQHHASVPAEGYRPLRRQQCRELLASGLVQLGAHTHTHHDFRNRWRRAGSFQLR